MLRKKTKKSRFDISVWVVISATMVLAVILGMMIFMQVQQRKNQAVSLFVEKGATLISSFEAGWRGRPVGKEELFEFQKLLMETSQQPDIDYLMITDDRGNILADSDPSMLGRSYGLDLNREKISASRVIRWRQTANPEGAGTFEVYRGFLPGMDDAQKNHLIVYVGFNMDKIEKASREDMYQTGITALILALIGSLAIVSLFLVQAYRLARASLSRITVFSEALVKNMPIALIAVDRTGKIVVCNEQAHAVLTGICSEATGKDASEIISAGFFEVLDRVNDPDGLIEEEVAIASGEDGEQIWEVIAAGFADENVAEGKILLAHNVTAIRRMEKEVTKSRHLNAIGSLAAGVAHEIRNPLSSIRGFAVYFRQKLSGNKEDEETADIMIAETERLNRVISQLIEFARPLQLKKEWTDIERLARETARLVAVDAMNQNVAMEIQVHTDQTHAYVDPDKMKQVLLNVFLNALAAMPAGGNLSVELDRQKDFLDVMVTDNGEGIKEEDLPRIYDPYFTSKPAGSGLGLAVVQKIMDEHSAAVRVESKAGKGTKVTLRFLDHRKREE